MYKSAVDRTKKILTKIAPNKSSSSITITSLNNAVPSSVSPDCKTNS